MSTPAFGAAPSFIQTEAPSIPSDYKLRWLELGLVLLCMVVPLLYASFFAIRTGAIHDVSNGRFGSAALHEVAGLCLLAYVLQRSGRNLRSIGLRLSWGGIGVGVVVFIVSLLVATIVSVLFRGILVAAGQTGIRQKDMVGMVRGASPAVLYLFNLLNPWFEELVVRAYVMTEITVLTRSTGLAILMSTLLQSAYHLYQGWYNAGVIAVLFLVYSIYYAGRRNIFPVIVAHFLQDMYATAWQLRRLHHS